MHANDVFYFLKIIFDISTSKRSKTYKPYFILVKKKIQIFGNTAAAAFPNIILVDVLCHYCYDMLAIGKKNTTSTA